MSLERTKCLGRFSQTNKYLFPIKLFFRSIFSDHSKFWNRNKIVSKWNSCLWSSNHASVELYDGFGKISIGFSKLHSWNWELWVQDPKKSRKSPNLKAFFSDGYAQADMELEMMGGTAEKAISGVEKLQLSQFEVHKHDFLYRLQKFATGSYPRLSLQFLLKRNIGYFLLQTYMPCSLITILR